MGIRSIFLKIQNISRRIFSLIFLSKKEWRFPAKADLVFYDSVGYGVFEDYLSRYNPVILYVRGEVLNIPILLLSLWKGSIRKYAEVFVLYTRPKLIVTFIDNNPLFYELKSKVPDIVTMFVQNGFRGEIGDIFGYLQPKESYSVDYMLTFGNDIGKKYSEYIKGNYLPIGSFKNNKTIKKSIESRNDCLLFISQYIAPSNNQSEPFFKEQDGSVYHWDQFYEAELLLLPFLKEYCLKNHLSLKVCGRSKKEDQDEINFYRTYFDGLNWSMTSNEAISYEIIDSNDLIVFVDSTLGYEALARGKKAAAFSARCKSLRNNSYRFGWPGDFPEDGSYWTNRMDTSVFEEVLDYLRGVSEEAWRMELERSGFSNLMEFDSGNTKFMQLVDQILEGSSSR